MSAVIPNDPRVRELLNEIKEECFVDSYKATDEEAMGLLVSRFLDYGGIEILKATEYALEDANFHTEGERVLEIRLRAEKDYA